jgi:hypothetical protein
MSELPQMGGWNSASTPSNAAMKQPQRTPTRGCGQAGGAEEGNPENTTEPLQQLNKTKTTNLNPKT